MRRREEAACLSASLTDFVKAAWPILLPGKSYLHNWHIDAIAEHLEAVKRREIKRLIINVPFRTMKSTLVSVMWPAYVWASAPEHQWLCVSHAATLAIRDNVAMRRLIGSKWYMDRWGDKFALTSDQNVKQRFDNDRSGYRIAAGMTAGVTGDGGDTILIDDPHDRDQAHSDIERRNALDAFDEKLVTRLNDPESGAIVVIMQRLHDKDLSGHLLEKGGWDHLMIPMEYEPAHPTPARTSLGWKDPRSNGGELMWPERFPPTVVDALKTSIGPNATAGQLQQRPSEAGGDILIRGWWKVWTKPEGPKIHTVVLSFDTAHKDGMHNDYSAMTAWGLFTPDGGDEDSDFNALLIRAWKRRLKFPALIDAAKSEANDEESRYGKPPEHVVIEDKASGQDLIQMMHDAGIDVFPYNPGRSDKVQRAHVASNILRSGGIWVLGRRTETGRSDTELVPAAEMVVSDCAGFPAIDHPDLVDTVTQALMYMRDCGFLKAGTDAEPDDDDAAPEPRGSVYG